MLDRKIFQEIYEAARGEKSEEKGLAGKEIQITLVDGSSYEVRDVGAIEEDWLSIIIGDGSKLYVPYSSILQVRLASRRAARRGF